MAMVAESVVGARHASVQHLPHRSQHLYHRSAGSSVGGLGSEGLFPTTTVRDATEEGDGGKQGPQVGSMEGQQEQGGEEAQLSIDQLDQNRHAVPSHGLPERAVQEEKFCGVSGRQSGCRESPPFDASVAALCESTRISLLLGLADSASPRREKPKSFPTSMLVKSRTWTIFPRFTSREAITFAVQSRSRMNSWMT